MAFVDDVAAGRHHHHATSCQSRKTKASRIKIVDRSSKSGMQISPLWLYQNLEIPILGLLVKYDIQVLVYRKLVCGTLFIC
ncbi:hypothetical protein P8452_33226 [Trifolium repens]|nr:hypothetical protein P8452_33226 [Trifolium repens]